MNHAEILLAILLGAIAGSFLSTAAVRRGAPLAGTRRSHCDRCGVVVPMHANVPILSFALLRGRCGACDGRIDVAHPVMEVVCASIGGIALAVAPGTSGWILAAFGWALALLALIDAREYRLPDAIVLPLGAAGFLAAMAGMPPATASRAIGVLAGVGALSLVRLAYRAARGREGLGRGDAKLLGAIGAWAGWQDLPVIVFAASMLGIVWVALDLLRGRPVADRLPFGTLLALAAWPTVAATYLRLP